jgi:hypothetical protein
MFNVASVPVFSMLLILNTTQKANKISNMENTGTLATLNIQNKNTTQKANKISNMENTGTLATLNIQNKNTTLPVSLYSPCC